MKKILKARVFSFDSYFFLRLNKLNKDESFIFPSIMPFQLVHFTKDKIVKELLSYFRIIKLILVIVHCRLSIKKIHITG